MFYRAAVAFMQQHFVVPWPHHHAISPRPWDALGGRPPRNAVLHQSEPGVGKLRAQRRAAVVAHRAHALDVAVLNRLAAVDRRAHEVANLAALQVARGQKKIRRQKQLATVVAPGARSVAVDRLVVHPRHLLRRQAAPGSSNSPQAHICAHWASVYAGFSFRWAAAGSAYVAFFSIATFCAATEINQQKDQTRHTGQVRQNTMELALLIIVGRT